MSIIKLKNTPKLRLGDLLRRRKMTLKQFMSDVGLTTYTDLVGFSRRFGVQPPTTEEFDSAEIALVSDPAHGVIVLPAPNVTDEKTGKVLERDDDILTASRTRGGFVFMDHTTMDPEPTETHQKKNKKKKENSQSDD